MDIAGPQPLMPENNMPENESAILDRILNALIHRMNVLVDDLETQQEVLDFLEETVIIAERMFIVGNEPLTGNGVTDLENLYWALFPRYVHLILNDVAFLEMLNNN
ncbi:hypothetical protein L5515_018899 [Caenorhabditis briggsae]|uniref:Uncharacterized protein n=1 Tax=Caenorhabditis briggsae TaxID=6238 RepID=A0AAE9JTG2_CAEBR|nr:hypothetical protein L5515_018899 [Caenorhabditis briggsae]